MNAETGNELTLTRTLRPVAMCKWIDRADAEPLYKRALAIREKALGPEHPKVAKALLNYAVLLRATGRSDEAAKRFPGTAITSFPYTRFGRPSNGS